MAERFIAAVLKTAGGKASVGSNPTPVAMRLAETLLCRMAVAHPVISFPGGAAYAAPLNAAWLSQTVTSPCKCRVSVQEGRLLCISSNGFGENTSKSS